MMYRIYLEETATRTFHKDIEARTRQAAEAQGQAARASDAWTEWTEGHTSASLELREELTSIIDAEGQETRLRELTSTRRRGV